MKLSPQPASGIPTDMGEVHVPVSYYSENASGMIYEVQFLPEAVLIRPATPALYMKIRRLDTAKFVKEFTEVLCSHDDITRYLAGGGTGFDN